MPHRRNTNLGVQPGPRKPAQRDRGRDPSRRVHRDDLPPLRARRARARPHPECDPSCSARPRFFHREAPPLSGSGRQPGRHDATEGHEEVGGRGAHSPGAIASALLSAASNGCPQCVAARFRRRDDHQRGTGRSAPLAAIDAGSTSRKPQPGQRDRANTAARRFFADTSEHRSRDPAAGIRCSPAAPGSPAPVCGYASPLAEVDHVTRSAAGGVASANCT